MRNTHALSNNIFLIREQEMLILEELIPGKAVLSLPHRMDMLALVAPTFPERSSGLILCGGNPAPVPCLIRGRGVVATLSIGI